eukprot:CAMPEP_0115851962 /NCGR_PEP_ID=MMETSP0287-20121206/12749_1 /TAXON_ID=412157 /ORGANISM="Chrysochromulina rotalis, Strain UIO044" /LENGTH=261 /DNA_ID=CAMNT_0003306005 /DNA_START=17 /DNA_END=802 /DNA_ORIENTATION=-
MSQAFCAMRRAMPSLLRAGIRSRSALPLGRPLGPEPQLRLPVAHHCRSLSDSVSTKPSGSKDSGGDNAAVEAEPLRNSRGEVVKTWGTSVDLPEVTKKEAEDAFLDATSVTRSMKPAIQEAVAARDDMLKDRFNYVSKNLNSDAQYVVMGGKGKVAPAAVGQASFLFAGLVVLLGAIGTVVYIKTQWGVGSAKELGDRLRERGAARKDALERSTSARLVRTVSSQAEQSVKSNVDIVRRPSQQLGEHFQESFKGVVKENRP